MNPNRTAPKHIIKMVNVEERIIRLPGGPVVKNLPANAGDNRFNSWSGRIPYAMGQISLCAATAESGLERTSCNS